MITYSIIQKSQLEGAKRLDAEYYQPEFLDVINKISKYKIGQLREILDDVRYGLYVEPDYQEEGVSFLRALNMVAYGIDGEILKIKKKEIPDDKYLLKEGDVLIVRSGANTGNVGIIEKYLENSTFGSYTICLRTKKINPYFLYAFLNGKFGKLQTLRLQTGMAQPNLNIPNIEEIKIPLNIKKEQQEEVEKIILQAFKIKEMSKSLYSQAENLLLEELNLKNFVDEEIPLNPPLPKGDIRKTPNLEEEEIGGFENNALSYIINLSDAKSANRFDAEYFEPKYKKLMSLIRANGGIKLGDLVSIKKGIEPGAESYREDGKQFIRVSSLSKYEISDGEQKCLSDELYDKLKADYQPQKGEILLTKDASPGITYVLKENIEGIISSGILRLKLRNKEVEDEYLALCLNSIIGKMQTERDSSGSVIMHWKPEEIKDAMIPILPKPIQQKISSFVRQSFESRKKAKQFLEEAKRKVEEMIEKA